MLLAIDIGNSLVKSAVFGPKGNVTTFQKVKSASDIGVLRNFFGKIAKEYDVLSVCISSVVVSRNADFEKCIVDCFGVAPVFVRYTGKLNFQVESEHPEQLGADIIATCIASAEIFPNSNVLTIALGTASVFSLITKDTVFRGAIIAPGLNMLESSLHSNLGHVTGGLRPVRGGFKIKNLMPKSTEDAVHAGITCTLRGGVHYTINHLKEELDDSLVVIATGGASRFLLNQKFQKKCLVDHFDMDFTMKGIYHYYMFNR